MAEVSRGEGSVGRRHFTEMGARLALVLFAGCATSSFAGNVYRDSQTAFRVGEIPTTWHRFDLSGADLTFRDDAGGTILVNGLCEGVKDVSLDVLTNQALFGMERKQVLSRDPITLDGRDALRTRLRGTMDGVAVELELVVMKKDNCTYDFQLVASPEAFPSIEPGFQRFVAGFRQLPRGGS